MTIDKLKSSMLHEKSCFNVPNEHQNHSLVSYLICMSTSILPPGTE